MEDPTLRNLGRGADNGGVNLESILRTAVERGASDVHLKVHRPPVIRFDGDLMPLEGFEPLDSMQLEEVLNTIGAHMPRRVALFHETGELDTAYHIADLP